MINKLKDDVPVFIARMQDLRSDLVELLNELMEDKAVTVENAAKVSKIKLAIDRLEKSIGWLKLLNLSR